MCQLTLLLIHSKLKQLLWEQVGPVDETSVSKRVYIKIDIYNLSLTGYTHPVTITVSKLGDIWLLSGIVSSLTPTIRIKWFFQVSSLSRESHCE